MKDRNTDDKTMNSKFMDESKEVPDDDIPEDDIEITEAAAPKVMSILAGEDDQGKRIDRYLSDKLEGYTRSYIQKLISDASVKVNDKVIRSSYKVQAGDRLNLTLPDPVLLEVKPENIKIKILYEDDYVIVVDKPQGMVVHPAAGNYTGTLVNALLWHCGEHLSGINGVIRPGIVHRIDKDTSGVLVVAKNNLAHLQLAQQIKDHTVLRKYWAVVSGNIREESGKIDAPIGRHPVERKKMAVNTKTGRKAVTHFKVLERFGEFTLVECRLETGRTHQIRVHMAYINHPVAGDPVYGLTKKKFNLEGQALHAKVLGFIHPATGEYMEFESPLPGYLEELLNKLRNNSQKQQIE